MPELEKLEKLEKEKLEPLEKERLDRALQDLAQHLRARAWMLATAESCTGGLVAATCTALAGSSQWFERGVVSYANAAKTELLGVDAALIAQHGAVSEAVARAMAQGALTHAHAQVSVAVTGIAGPGGGSPDKPVGLVWFAWCYGGRTDSARQYFEGRRDQVRDQAVRYALTQLAARLKLL